MQKQCNEINWSKEKLWSGCILASLAHAIMVAHYPELSHEHAWDGPNYSVQNSAGARGTITFSTHFVIAAFRNDQSERLYSSIGNQDAFHYFDGAPIEVVRIAESEALQYLLDDVNGSVKPLITSAFWGTKEKCYSIDIEEQLMEQGAFLIQNQLMNFEQALQSWKVWNHWGS